MAEPQQSSLPPGRAATPVAAGDPDRSFKAGATLLALLNVACGVFAYLAEKGVWNKDLDFAIAFTLLGIIFIGIFALAGLDSRTRTENQDWEYHH